MAQRMRRLLLWLAACAGLAGCGAAPPAPADPGRAREALSAGLDAWKSGATSDSLQQRSPPIVFRDEDWKAGWKLKSYRAADTDEEFGSQRRCQVQLTLESPTGKAATKDVKYVIDTTPALVVMRVAIE